MLNQTLILQVPVQANFLCHCVVNCSSLSFEHACMWAGSMLRGVFMCRNIWGSIWYSSPGQFLPFGGGLHGIGAHFLALHRHTCNLPSASIYTNNVWMRYCIEDPTSVKVQCCLSGSKEQCQAFVRAQHFDTKSGLYIRHGWPLHSAPDLLRPWVGGQAGRQKITGRSARMASA